MSLKAAPAAQACPLAAWRGIVMSFVLSYDDAIQLDAEALAEAGIAEAYERVLSRLRRFTNRPLSVIEERDDAEPSYAVRCGSKRFVIFAPQIEETTNS